MSFWPFLISSTSAWLVPHAASVTAPRSTIRTDLLSITHLPGWVGLKRGAPRVSRPRLRRRPGRREDPADRAPRDVAAARTPPPCLPSSSGGVGEPATTPPCSLID